jgi:peptidoglycan/LPS O-acetylase OafA/YrhL
VAQGRRPADIAVHGRIDSLDGLRGIAALVVVLHHILLTSPALAEPYRTGGGGEGLVRWLAYTPLHLFWLGTEPVLIFFVLSGFVLTLPVLSGRTGSWSSYYRKRLPRLYLPVWAAVGLAVVLNSVVSRDDVAAGSWWLNAHEQASAWGVLGDLMLLVTPGATYTALWSLQWEMWFSLTLPLFVGAALFCVRRAPVWGTSLAAAGLIVLMLVGQLLDARAMRFMPVFGLGVLMAVERARLASLAAWLSSRRMWPVAAVGAVVLLLADWLVHGIVAEPPSLVYAAGVSLRMMGAAMVVHLFLHWRPAQRAATARPLRWLGSRSFSLYLVHEPIVVAVAFLLVAPGGVGLVLVVALPVALFVAELFFRAVEAPSHRFARLIGGRAGAPLGGAAST